MESRKKANTEYNRKNIEQHLASALNAATPDVWSKLDLTVPQDKPEKGQEKQRPKASVLWMRRHMGGAAAAACICLLAVGGKAYHYECVQVVSQVGIDVNPSVKLSLNRRDRVVQAEGLNEDGAALLEMEQMKGWPVEAAVNQVVDALAARGYFDEAEQEHAVLVSVAGSTAKRAEAVKSTVSSQVETALAEKQVKAVVYDQTVEVTPELEELADTYAVSLGKAEFIGQLVSQNPSLSQDAQGTFDRMMDQTMEELNQEINEYSYSTNANVTIIAAEPAEDSSQENMPEVLTREERRDRRKERAKDREEVREEAGQEEGLAEEEDQIRQSEELQKLPQDTEELPEESSASQPESSVSQNEKWEPESEPELESAAEDQEEAESETSDDADAVWPLPEESLPEEESQPEEEEELASPSSVEQIQEEEESGGSPDLKEGETIKEGAPEEENPEEVNSEEADSEEVDSEEADSEASSSEESDTDEVNSEEADSQDKEEQAVPSDLETEESKASQEPEDTETAEASEEESSEEESSEEEKSTVKKESLAETADQERNNKEEIHQEELLTEESQTEEEQTAFEEEELVQEEGGSRIIHSSQGQFDGEGPGDMITEPLTGTMITSNGTQIIFETIEEEEKEPEYASQFLSELERQLLEKGPGAFISNEPVYFADPRRVFGTVIWVGDR